MPLKAALTAILLAAAGSCVASEDAGEPESCWSAHRAAGSLFARIGDDGRFAYRLDATGRPLGGYNVVRHAGVLWVLEGYDLAYPDPDHAARLARASDWLATCCLRRIGDWPVAAVWSAPEGKPDIAKLGAAGLALAAWELRAAYGRSAPDAVRRLELARFIVYLQRPDGSFHSRFRNQKRDDSWDSLYYPGEAAVGLLTRYRSASDAAHGRAAESARRRLAVARVASGRSPADHWALIATRAFVATGGAPDAALLLHARRVAEGILAEQSAMGDFGNERRTAPAATRLEALAAAYDLLAVRDPAFGAHLLAAHARGAAFLRRVQLDGGAIPRAASDSPDPRRAETRIDDTQHALSVFLDDARLQNHTCTRP
jgi:hypothetical protein